MSKPTIDSNVLNINPRAYVNEIGNGTLSTFKYGKTITPVRNVFVLGKVFQEADWPEILKTHSQA